MKRIFFCIIYITFFLNSLFSYDKLIINDIEEGSKLYRNMVQELYRRMNLEVEFVKIPVARALESSNSGTTDGELVRGLGILAKYKNLVFVPTPLFTLTIYAYATNSGNFIVESPININNYSIVILRGIKILGEITKGMDVIEANSLSSIFKLVETGRVDIAVIPNIINEDGIKELGFKNIYRVEPPITNIPVYHMLNEKHRELLPKLDLVVKEMVSDGTVDRLFKEYGY